MQSVYAIQAYPVRKTVKTVDGATITVTLKGDERFSYYSDDEGTKFKQLPSGLFERYSENELLDIYQQVDGMRQEARSRQMSARSTRGALTGERKGLVILAEFSDLGFTVGNNAIFTDMFNKPGYSNYGMTGSVHDFFKDQSYGQFDLSFDIVGPVQLPETMKYYGEHVGNNNDKNAKQFAVDAVNAAAPLVGDFSPYDWDNDGYADQVFIVFAGYNEAEGGPKESIWPHEWTIGEYKLEFNGIKIATYGCSSEFKGNSGAKLCGVGTACHEFSHCLGLMDMYDTSGGNSFGMGDWDIMSSGNYLGESCCPMAYTAFERWVSGWLSPVEISKEMSVKGMKAVEDEPEAYVLFNDANSNEFYLLENRQVPKWGKDIKAHGLLVVHVDYDGQVWWSNKVNIDPNHQRMTVVAADNMLMSSNYAGDPFPGSRNKTELTDTSTPAASLYNENVDGTFLMGKPITNIQETSAGLISFDAMKGVVFGPENLEAKALTDESFNLNWQSVANADHYEVNISEIHALNDNPYLAFLLEDNFAEKCKADKVNTLNKISGSLDRFGLTKGWTADNAYRAPKGLQLGKGNAGGTAKSPEIKSYYGLMTPTIKISPATAGSSVSLSVTIYVDGNKWGGWNNIQISEEVSYVLTGLPEEKSNISFEITSSAPMNLSYFSVHEGVFDEDDFDKDDSVHKFVEETKTSTVDVNSTSYLVEHAKAGSIYKCRVRAAMPTEGEYSKWSQVITVELQPTSLEAIRENAIREDSWYDLNGNKVTENSKSGIFINNQGKLVMIP